MGFIPSVNKPLGGIVHAFDQPLEPVKQESGSAGKAFKGGAQTTTASPADARPFATTRV